MSARLRSGRSLRKERTRRRRSAARAVRSVRSESEKRAGAAKCSDQADDRSWHCCLRLVVACLTNGQARFSLKYLVPLAAIGSAYLSKEHRKGQSQPRG